MRLHNSSEDPTGGHKNAPANGGVVVCWRANSTATALCNPVSAGVAISDARQSRLDVIGAHDFRLVDQADRFGGGRHLDFLNPFFSAQTPGAFSSKLSMRFAHPSQFMPSIFNVTVFIIYSVVVIFAQSRN